LQLDSDECDSADITVAEVMLQFIRYADARFGGPTEHRRDISATSSWRCDLSRGVRSCGREQLYVHDAPGAPWKRSPTRFDQRRTDGVQSRYLAA